MSLSEEYAVLGKKAGIHRRCQECENQLDRNRYRAKAIRAEIARLKS